uniref:Adventurous gliding motility protein X n=1 Tax=Myxococcus xanthus TaxID=34 RepID=UPI0023674144|nr:Chain A, Adventurous gliding motility protein GltJ [Myxococcus xanthus]
MARFVCDSCRAQYMISDDKIGPKGVKVRCKKCGHTITVRPAGALEHHHHHH